MKLYKTLLVKSLEIRQTTEEVTKTVESITTVETMHRMAMVMKIIGLTASTLAAVQEDVGCSII